MKKKTIPDHHQAPEPKNKARERTNKNKNQEAVEENVKPQHTEGEGDGVT